MNLNGKRFTLNVPDSIFGWELQQIATESLPYQEGIKLAIQHGSSPLNLNQTLRQQGITGESMTLSFVYLPVNLHAAWMCLKGKKVVDWEFSLCGVTQIHKMIGRLQDLKLPESLQSLTLSFRGLGGGFIDQLQDLNLRFDQTWSHMSSRSYINWPQKLRNLTLAIGSQSLHGICLPEGLQSLTLTAAEKTYFHMDQIDLPRKLQHLNFGDGFNQPLSQCVFDANLPPGLRSLILGKDFNQCLDDIKLPQGLETLTFGRSYNQSLQNVHLPEGLQRLTFGYYMNQNLDEVVLPTGLQALVFGYSFNKTLENVTLPVGLQVLTFGYFFNHSLENVQLPSNLQTLTFGDHFNRSLDDVKLPNSLQSLTLGHFFRQPLDHVKLPSSLQSFNAGRYLQAAQIPHQVALLKNLRALTAGQNWSFGDPALPQSLQSLTLQGRFDRSLHEVNLPEGLQSLTFGDRFNQSINGVMWPSRLQSLTFGRNFNQSLEDATLPSGLVTLTFGDSFDQSLDLVNLPDSLETLTFGTSFNKSLDQVKLPLNLKSLTLGRNFNHSLGVALPSSLQDLVLGEEFKHSLGHVTLPNTLRRLILKHHGHHENLAKAELPSCLQVLCCGGSLVSCKDWVQETSETSAERLTAATARAQVTERDPSAIAAEPAKSPTEMPQMDAERSCSFSWRSAELMEDSAFALPSPTEMPVPTDMPSPTSPADPAFPTAELMQDIPIPGVPGGSSALESSVMSSSQRPRSPSEMPVPTEQPLPTSPADGQDGEMDPPVEEPSVASTEADPADDAPPVPVPKLPSTFGVVPTLPPPGSAEVPERSVDSAVFDDSAPNTPEPDMPVPTDVPSPTSPADGSDDEAEAPLAAPPPAPIGGPLEEKPPEDFPPPMPESAPMSSDAATSPVEPPVPMAEEVRSAPISARHSAPMSSAIPGTATPSDGIRVPTDMPSPTSPARPEVMRGPLPPEVQQQEEDLGSAPLVSASAFFGASTTTVSPSEVPVPTDQPSPTSPAGVLKPPATAVTAAAAPAVPGGESARPISSVLDSSDMLHSSGHPESPTEMPVPTDVPSPTTPCEDEGETVTVPTVIPTAQSPTRTVGEATAETPTQTLIAEGGTVATARTPTATRTFVEVRRPEVPTVPTQETPTRTIQVPSTQSHTRTPQEARTAITATVTQSRTRSTRSTRPTRTFLEAGSEPLVEVPTDVPSPTSPAADPTREMETELPPSVLPPTATVLEGALASGDDEDEPTILPVPASAEPQVEEPAVEAVTPTDVPSPTSPADAEVGTLPTVEIPTLVPLQQADSALEATSPASRMEEEAFSPPQVRKRRRLREEVRPSTPTERFSAPPVPATPTESGTATPTEDALLVPPQEDGLEATSPASPLAEDQALLSPPEARKARRKRPAPEIPLLIASPTEEGEEAEPTPTEDVLLVPPQVRVSSRSFCTVKNRQVILPVLFYVPVFSQFPPRGVPGMAAPAANLEEDFRIVRRNYPDVSRSVQSTSSSISTPKPQATGTLELNSRNGSAGD
eukprot:s602_g6.t1